MPAARPRSQAHSVAQTTSGTLDSALVMLVWIKCARLESTQREDSRAGERATRGDMAAKPAIGAQSGDPDRQPRYRG